MSSLSFRYEEVIDEPIPYVDADAAGEVAEEAEVDIDYGFGARSLL